MRVLFLLPLSLVLGCTFGPGSKSPTSGTTDTGEEWMDEPPGCISIDGHGDFATIAEAITAAPEASTVSVCPGTYMESVVLDKTVSISGEDVATTIITPPTNLHAFEVSGAGAAIANFTITGASRSGVYLSDATDVSVSNVVFDGPANYGVESTASTGTIVTGCTFTQPGFGGISISGGSVTVDATNFAQPYGYGVLARDGADVTLTSNVFDGTVAAAGDGSDGFTIYADGASVTMNGNTITNPDIIGVYVLDAALSMSGDTVTGGAYGVVAAGSAGTTTTLNNVTITDAYHQGLFVVSADPVVIDGLTITIAAEASDSWTYAQWGTRKGDIFCGAALIEADEVAVSNAAFTGYENYSLYAASFTGSGNYTITDSSFRDAGRNGITIDLGSGTADLTNVTVDSIREPEIAQPCSGYVDQSTGIRQVSSTVNLTGVTISNNAGWGFTDVQGEATITDSLIDGNYCTGFVNYEAVATITGTTFTHATQMGSIYDATGALTLTGNTFIDNHAMSISEYDDGLGNITRYESDNYGRDMYLYQSASVVISGNTFSEGDVGIVGDAASVSVTNNTFTGYERSLLEVGSTSDTDPAIFADNTVDDIGAYVVYASSGFVEVENVTVGTTHESETSSRSFTNDVLNYEYSYTSAYPAFGAYGSYYSYDDGTGNIVTVEGPAGLRITNVEFGDTVHSLVNANDARIEIDGLHVGQIGGSLEEAYSYAYAIYAYSDGAPSEVIINDFTATSTTGTAFYIYNGNATEGYIDIGNVDVGSVGYVGSGASGFEMAGNASYTISHASFTDVDGSGLTNDGDYYYYDYLISDYVYGVVATVAIVDGLSVMSAGEDGISFTDGDLSLTNSTLMAGVGDGIEISGATVSSGTGEIIGASATITGNIITANAGYGMVCTETTLDGCSANDLTGNGLGEQVGCDDGCGI